MSLPKILIILGGGMLVAWGVLYAPESIEKAHIDYSEFGQKCTIEPIQGKLSYPLSSTGVAMGKNESHTAYIVSGSGSMRVVYDGKPGKNYFGVYDLMLSEDGLHTLYRTEDGSR